MKWTVSRKMADSYMEKRNELNEQILHCRSELSKICPAVLVQSIRAKIQDANSPFYSWLLDFQVFEQEWTQGWPCYDTNLAAFHM